METRKHSGRAAVARFDARCTALTFVAALFAIPAFGQNHASPAANGARAANGQQVTTIAGVGFASPENLVFDKRAGVYLVSNINGQPRARDGNGFISRVSPNGKIVALKWIDGKNTSTRLDAPKGIAINGDTIAVADVGAVRFFNERTGASLGVRTVPGELMNDVAFGKDGSVYVTDTGPDAGKPDTADHDAIYRLYPDGRTVAIVRSRDLGGPDGIAVADTGLAYATFKGHTINEVSASGARHVVVNMPGGRDDGLRQMPDGSYVVSSWDTKTVYRLLPDGTLHPILTGVTSPAGLAYDTERQMLAVTSMQENKLYLLPLK